MFPNSSCHVRESEWRRYEGKIKALVPVPGNQAPRKGNWGPSQITGGHNYSNLLFSLVVSGTSRDRIVNSREKRVVGIFAEVPTRGPRAQAVTDPFEPLMTFRPRISGKRREADPQRLRRLSVDMRRRLRDLG